MTGAERSRAIRVLGEALEILRALPIPKDCTNCDNMGEAGLCDRWQAIVPLDELSNGCDQWLEKIPF